MKVLVLLVLLTASFLPYVPYANASEITSPYGWRVHPITGEYAFHTGVDVAYAEGTPITACMAGTVVYAAPLGGYGNAVIIQHGNGLTTLYAHCQRLFVSYADRVTTDTVIALAGSTGNVTGPHLHLELWENGAYADPTDLLND